MQSGWGRTIQTRKNPQFLTLEPHFVQKGGHIGASSALPAVLTKKRKRRRETVTEGKRQTERERERERETERERAREGGTEGGRERRCEDVKM